jgi:hypothetical protein
MHNTDGACYGTVSKTATKVVKDADMARVYINHGVEHQRRILCHKGNATFDVCFNHSQKVIDTF